MLFGAKRKLPLPPPELRDLVGGHDVSLFDNPSRKPIFDWVPKEAYDSVLDFGCGCGRLARQLIQQKPRPTRYLGIDLHRGMITWCQENLAPVADGFEFKHHDVHNIGLNPTAPSDRLTMPFPADDESFSLVLGTSVFTHLIEAQAEPYLREIARVLRPGGFFHSTFFTFDKEEFPMLQTFQNALYVNPTDPTNAVIYDRDWLRRTSAEAGLTPVKIQPPAIRGYHWSILFARSDEPAAEWPEDVAAPARHAPPLMPADADQLGIS